jgi:hypothetical protein
MRPVQAQQELREMTRVADRWSAKTTFRHLSLWHGRQGIRTGERSPSADRPIEQFGYGDVTLLDGPALDQQRLNCANTPSDCFFTGLQCSGRMRPLGHHADRERPNHDLFTRGYDRPRGPG